MSVETELKLQINLADADHVVPTLKHLLGQLAGHAAPPQRLYSVYFDTADHELATQGIAIRIRRIGQRRVQTVKTAGTVLGGLHQRGEWEVEIPNDVPNFSLVPRRLLPAWCYQAKHVQRIQPLFNTDFLRLIWSVELANQTRIEVALDQGEIATATATAPIRELELELKSGSVEQLYQLALTLQEAAPLMLGNQSKAERGYRLHKPVAPRVHKATPIELSEDMGVEDSFVYIMTHCLKLMQSNEAIVLESANMEGLHQMRVALRRLRSCLKLFHTLIPKDCYQTLSTELKWISNTLGVARDWDIYNGHLQRMQTQLQLNRPFSQGAERNALSELQTVTTDYQQRAYGAVKNAIESIRYHRLLLQLNAWLVQRPWRQEADMFRLSQLEAPIVKFSQNVLKEQYKNVLQRGEQFSELNEEQRHNLRIALKKLSYGTRFFAELYPNKSVQRYVKRLRKLQDELGLLNDISVAATLPQQNSFKLSPTAQHFLDGWFTYEQQIHFVALEKSWHKLLKQKVFWK